MNNNNEIEFDPFGEDSKVTETTDQPNNVKTEQIEEKPAVVLNDKPEPTPSVGPPDSDVPIPQNLPSPPTQTNKSDIDALTSGAVVLRLTPHGKRFQVKIKMSDLVPGEIIDPEFVRGDKNLIDAKALKDIHDLDRDFKNQIRNIAIPETFLRGSLFIIPVGFVERIERMIPEYEEARKGLVDDLILKYDSLIDEAQRRLPARLFKRNEYPSIEVIQAKFVVSKGYLSLALPGGLAGQMPETYKKMEGELQEAVSDIREALRESFQQIVGHMSKILGVDPETGKKPRIFDATIDKALEFIENFKGRNILNDKELESLVSKAGEILKGVGAKDLRKNENFRENVKTQIDSIKVSLETLTAGSKTRKLSFDDDDDL